MQRSRRDKLTSFVLLPAVLVAVGVLAYFTFRTTLQVDRLGQQSVLEATLGLANEKADRVDKRILEQDTALLAIVDPTSLQELPERWLPTAHRETPTVRALLVLDESHTVLVFASRTDGAWTEEEAFRRLLVEHMVPDMELGKQPLNEARHLHREYRGQSYLVSYWQREVAGAGRYLVVAWHDIGRVVKQLLPTLLRESTSSPAFSNPANVVDEEGRIIYGPPLRTREFTVGVRFPTTLTGWTLQMSPTKSEELAYRVQNRRLLEVVLMGCSCIVLVLGVAIILVAAERERRVSALKSEFVANVSHELKTPLSLVRMFAEMLQSGRVASEAKRQEYLDIIVSESERLSALIENVLDFAKVERGRGSYDFAPGNVGEAVMRAVNVYRYRAEREGTSLVLEIDPNLPIVMLDERAVQLAVINLLDNALKYAPGGDEIRIAVKREKKRVLVRVIDKGPGVAAEDRERIFERFVRGSHAAKSDDTSPVRGSGIGLALVKHIAESHGGDAWVESSPGKGSTFTLSIAKASSPSREPSREGDGPESGAIKA